jgi:hypothetical protein
MAAWALRVDGPLALPVSASDARARHDVVPQQPKRTARAARPWPADHNASATGTERPRPRARRMGPGGPPRPQLVRPSPAGPGTSGVQVVWAAATVFCFALAACCRDSGQQGRSWRTVGLHGAYPTQSRLTVAAARPLTLGRLLLLYCKVHHLCSLTVLWYRPSLWQWPFYGTVLG